MPEAQQYDVIVVGAGGSGLAAGCSAAERGGRVLVLEKRPQPGGTTGIAVGSFTAAETRWQQAAGIADRVQDHVEDAGKFAEPAIEARNNPRLREYFLCEAARTLDWISRYGVTLVGPSPEPPNRVARMHNVVPGAKAYIAALQLALLRAGGRLVCQAEVRRLIVERGRVCGVEAVVDGQARRFLARRGVILAAGDYANSPDLIAREKGPQFRQIEGINPYATGDGQRLAADAGAALVNMDVTYGPELRFVASRRRPFQQWLPARGPLARLVGGVASRLPAWVMQRMIKRLLVTWQHPENSLFDDGAILVNQLGQRFVDERRWPDREIAVAAQPGKLAYILLDGRLSRRYSTWPHFISTAPDIAYAYVNDYLRLRPDVACRDQDLNRLAWLRRIPPDALQASLRECNQLRQNDGSRPASEPERDSDRTTAAGLSPLSGGPWVLLGPVKAYFTTTEGGAAVNQDLQVLDPSGDVIPGLYAVGQNGLGGMILWGHGLHIAWALTSGRLAGRAVMGER